MLGAIAGDIAGSIYEFHNIKTKDFILFANRVRWEGNTRNERAPRITDDSVMTLAVAAALTAWKSGRSSSASLYDEAVSAMQDCGRRWPEAGYGGRFRQWIFSGSPRPYGSYGNGAAMRISPCAWLACSLDEALEFARIVTETTHDHPESLKAAEAVTKAVWMGRHGASRDEIRQEMEKFYDLDFTLDEIRPGYRFDVSCRGSVPQAIVAFLESTGFEDALRNAVSIGGDSDTIACIAGGIAEAFYGLPPAIGNAVMDRLEPSLRSVALEFLKAVGTAGKTPQRNAKCPEVSH